MDRVPSDVIGLISKYLRQHDMACCARVCKSWNTIFIPPLYRHIKYTNTVTRAFVDQLSYGDPSQCSTLNKYSHHTQILEAYGVKFPDPKLLGPNCWFLTEIRVGGVDGLDDPGWIQRLINIVNHNPHINKLAVNLVRPGDDLDKLIASRKLLKGLPELKFLELRGGVIKRKTTLCEIMNYGSRLQQLHFEIEEQVSVEKVAMIRAEDDFMLSNLHTLSVTYSGPFVEELIQRSPNLRRFSVRTRDHDGIVSSIQKLIQHYDSGYPICLEHLRLGVMEDCEVTELPLFRLFELCAEFSGLESLSLERIPITECITRGLTSFHADTLTKVRLTSCTSYYSSLGIQQILSTCPKLRCLVTEDMVLYMEDIERSEWICKGLQVLKVYIRGKWPMKPRMDPSLFKTINELKRHAWHQIEEMIELQILHVSTAMDNTDSTKCRHFQVGDEILCSIDVLTMCGGGMEAICKLSRLLEVKTGTKCDRMKETEANVLRLARPRLRMIAGLS